MLPFYVWGKQTCYDLKLGIYDENDLLIIEGKRQTVCTGDFSYLFTKIPQEKLSVLDSKKYKIKLLGIWLNYGVYDISLMTDDDIKNKTIRGIVKPLPDIKIQTENVVFFDVIEKHRLERERMAKEEEERAELERQRAEERAIEIEEWKEFIEEMQECYNAYELRKNSLSSNIVELEKKIGIQFSNSEADSNKIGIGIRNVLKKSIASKAKIKTNYRLTKINNKNVEDIKDEATIILDNYNSLERLITDAKELTQNYDKLQAERWNIEYMFDQIPDIDDCYIFALRNGGVTPYYNVDNIPSGINLTFEVFGEYMIWDPEIIEITVP